jgi:hypothetical protein
MMGDLISRQEAIDGILQFMPTKLRDAATLEEQINYVAWRCALGCAVSSVGTQTSAKSRWIPCSERLPERGASILVSQVGYVWEDYLDIDDGAMYFWNSGIDLDEELNNLAWQPLPEPWKGETDE